MFTKNYISYPKVYNIYDPRTTQLFFPENLHNLYVEEKIDGSQFSFGLINNELVIRSRGSDLSDRDLSDGGMFKRAIETVHSLNDNKKLAPNYLYRGEVLNSPKHNTIKYDRVPEGNIILFDVMKSEEGTLFGEYVSRKGLEAEARCLELEFVPLLSSNLFNSFNEYESSITNPLNQEFDKRINSYLDNLLETNSILGGSKIEGLVFKQIIPKFLTRYGAEDSLIIVKYVSAKFRELNKVNWKEHKLSITDVVSDFTESVNKEAVYEKGLQRLRDSGVLTNSLNDIGPLIGDVARDFVLESEEILKEKMWNWAKKIIGRKISQGIPDWYKERLSNNFNNALNEHKEQDDNIRI